MPAAVGLDHVQLAMPAGGEDDARAFYVGILGLVERTKPPALAARGGCWFALAASTAEVGQVHLGVESGFGPAKKAHPGLVVDDLDAIADLLRRRGFRFEPDGNIAGRRRGHSDDPFGNRVELIQA